MESRAGLISLIILAALGGSLYLGYKKITSSAFNRGYDEGYSIGYDDKADDMRPVLEEAYMEQQEMLRDFYTLQTSYNELRYNVSGYLTSIGQRVPYMTNVECITKTAISYEYKGCY